MSRQSSMINGFSPPVGKKAETLPALWTSARRVEFLSKKKDGNSNTDKRWFVLSSENILYWFKNKEGRVSQNGIKFNEYNFVDVPQSFKFRLEGKSNYLITCPSAESKEEWRKLKTSRDFESLLTSNGRMIKRSELQITDKLLGEGASGGVKSGIWSGKNVAVKALKNELSSEEEMEEFQKEIEILSKLNNPHVVHMWGGCMDANTKSILLVTEYVGGGHLGEYIHDLEKYPRISRGVIQKVVLNISHGMKYICDAGLIHKDLKPANILVKDLKKGDIKICDFGLTVAKASECFGTPLYAAPELRENPTPAADVFSFGIIVWELHSRKLPFWDEPGIFSSQITEKYRQGIRPPLTSDIEMQTLIKRCWETNPESRANFETIVGMVQVLIESNPGGPTMGEEKEGLLEKFESKNELRWEDFKKAVFEIYGCPKSILESLKLVLCQHESVTKSKVSEFFEKRFTNIVHEKVEKENTWRLSEISTLIGHTWFVDCSDNEAEKIISQLDDGSWMVRFSSAIDHLTLSAHYKGKTYKMRIKVTKDSPKTWTVSPGDISFTSLDELAKFYRTNEWVTKECSFCLGNSYQGKGADNYSNPTESFLKLSMNERKSKIMS